MANAPEDTFDILLLNGRVIDGTGGPWFRADVGIKGDRIVAIGKLDGQNARRAIDVAGKVIAPGFIDVHVHSEIGHLMGTVGEIRVRQGITTDLMAPDGLSYAPLSRERLEETRQYLAIIYGNPDIEWNWSSLDEYLQRFEGRIAINLVPQVAFNAVRTEAVGWAPRPATRHELERMKELTRDAMEAGACGIQTGLEYYPSAHSGVDELIEVCRVVAEYGGVHSSHLRYYGERFNDALDEVFTISRETGVPFHASHLLIDADRFGPVHEAREKGIDITFDGYPYMAGNTHLIYCLPAWAQWGTPSEVIDRLRSPKTREKLRPEINSFFSDRNFSLDDIVFSATGSGANRHLLGRTLAQALQESNKDLTDFLCDLLVQEEMQVLAIFHWHKEERLRHAITDPLHMACSDGIYQGGLPHPRAYGAFPRMISYIVFEKRWLRIEEAIRKMTSAPAARYGLVDRGILRPGMAADIVVFDTNKVRDKATFENPCQFATGILHVFVNGRQVLENGEMKNIRPGRILKAR